MHYYLLFVVRMSSQPDATSIIRQLPRSVDPYKWLFGLEILVGLKPFNSVLIVPNSVKSDPRLHRPSIVSVVSCWGMFFFLLHCILYTTSIAVWQFTDIYSLVENNVGFMKTNIVLAQVMGLSGVFVMFQG